MAEDAAPGVTGGRVFPPAGLGMTVLDSLCVELVGDSTNEELAGFVVGRGFGMSLESHVPLDKPLFFLDLMALTKAGRARNPELFSSKSFALPACTRYPTVVGASLSSSPSSCSSAIETGRTVSTKQPLWF